MCDSDTHILSSYHTLTFTVETSNNIAESIGKVIKQELHRLLEGKSIVQFNADFLAAQPNSIQYRLSG